MKRIRELRLRAMLAPALLWALAASAVAQDLEAARTTSPWTVTVTPTLDPLPVGLCAAVHLTIVDASGREVRNPQGYRLTMADFDMTVNSPAGAVAGQQIDRSHWVVCGCPGALPGTRATVTASYPAQALSELARVPDVSFQSTATFAVSPAKGTVVPTGCAQTAAASHPPAPPPFAASDPFAPRVDLPAPPETPSRTTEPGLTPSPTPVATSPAPLPTTGARLPPGTAPGSPSVTGTPASATVSWAAADGASGYSVERWSKVNPDCCRITSPPLQASATSWEDSNYPLEGGYAFRVTALHANGAQGTAEVSWERPAPQDPASFKAVHAAGTTVDLTWHSVPGVTRYLVSGPGGTSTTPVSGTTLSVTGVPSGPRTWKISSLYEPGGVLTKGVEASTVVRALPSHAPAWLSKHDAGASPDVYWTSDQQYVCGGSYTGVGYSDAGNWNGCGADLNRIERKYQGLTSSTMVLTPPQARASYRNTNDLGVARQTYCFTKGASAMCVSSSHLLAPEPPGTPATPYKPGAPGEGPQSIIWPSAPWNAPLGYTAIIADPLGMRFLSFYGDLTRWSGFTPYWQTVSMADSEGLKPTPQTCLACHGGRWNPVMGVVTGATMLPIDPSNLEFEPGTRAQNEESIRKLNMVVLARSPSPAVATYIKGLYNGAPQQPGMAANDNYVPPGWTQQAGFYRSVIKPYCANCHMTSTTTVDLSSFGSVQRNKALIYAAVCTQKSMPHSETSFRQFWTKDTGAVYLPGYFAAVLGYASCP